MSQPVNIRHHNVEAGATPVMAIPANPARLYLCIQNKSNTDAVVTAKVDVENFTPEASSVQRLVFSQPHAENDGGGFKLKLGEEVTAEISAGDGAAHVQTALEALTGVGAGNVACADDGGSAILVTFQGAKANQAMPALEVVDNTLTNSGIQVEHVQVISFSHKPEAGTFRVLLGEAETGDQAWDVSTATLKAQINTLGGPQVGSISRNATSGALTITFDPTVVTPTLAVTENSLTNNDAQASSVQKVYAAPIPAAGSFKLMFGDQTTASIPYNATADQVRDAIRDLPGVDEGNVAVAGDSLTAGFTVTLQGALASQALPTLIPTQNNLADAGGEEVRMDVVQDTLGGSLTPCVATVARTVAGSPGAVEVTAEVLVDGTEELAEGYEILAGAEKSFETAVPIGAVYVIANNEGVPVEVLEG